MKRVFIIQNPVASRAHSRGLRAIEDELAAHGLRTSVAVTEGHGHAVDLARQAVDSGADLIAVYGGDGTIMQAVEGMRVSPAPIGLIPGGTGNLLAGNLRIPRDPRKAAAIIATGTPRRIDLGRLHAGGESRYFAVGCGAGYDADMMAGTTHDAKRRWGVGAYIGYVVRTAHAIRPLRFRITVDGRAAAYEASSVIVSNCGEILPPVMSLGPDVAIDDGVLDVVILRASGFLGAVRVVWQLLRHQETDSVRRIRGQHVEVEVDAETDGVAAAEKVVQADGDLCGHTPFTASIEPLALTVMTPPA